MPRDKPSLLAGRNGQPLSEQDGKRVTNTCLGLDNRAPFIVASGERTRFRLIIEEGGEEPQIIFGEDVFPGLGVADPNSSLSMPAAIAHELTHYYRWQDKTEINSDELEHIDEAITSLEAILRYYSHLNETDHQTLIRDALLRLHMFAKQSLDED